VWMSLFGDRLLRVRKNSWLITGYSKDHNLIRKLVDLLIVCTVGKDSGSLTLSDVIYLMV
jgi:hypothetical protein